MFDYRLEHIMSYNAKLGEPELIGPGPEGLRVNVYVTEGQVTGPRVSGKLRPVGGDWLTIRRDGIGILDVRVTIETNDKALIYAAYSGTRSWYAGGGVAGSTFSGSYATARGTTGNINAGRQYNAWTGNATRSYDRTINGANGGSGNVARATNYNTYTGQRSTANAASLSGPLWLPYTGTTLPTSTLIITSIISCAFASLAFVLSWRYWNKRSNRSLQPTAGPF